ncbi:hypothetical protein V8E51_019152 [Hyaloscypha variabilis]
MTDAVSLAASTIKLVQQVTSLISSIRHSVSESEAKAQRSPDQLSDVEQVDTGRPRRSTDIWDDLGEQMDDLMVYLTILSEMLDIINGASVEFPPSVGLALKTCANQTSRMSTYHSKLAKSIITPSKFPRFSVAFLGKFEAETRAFRESVMLFRQLVISATSGNTTNIVYHDHSQSYNKFRSKPKVDS